MVTLLLAVTGTAQTKAPAAEEPPPAVPPKSIPQFHWEVRFETQDVEGNEYTWTGKPVEFLDSRMLFRADYIKYNRDTGDLDARGHVYYRSFEQNEQLWCDHLEYNTEEKTGKFYNVRGEIHQQSLPRPGILTTTSPFHFEGDWAERIGTKYVLHDGWVTNCKLPKPWWRLRGPTFDIVPGERAITHRSIFLVRRFPLFYAPYFYHSLEEQPRKSGFLTPTFGHSSIGGFMAGAGYFWAVNRSNDVTYRVIDYFSRGYAHHVDVRGKPRPGTDYDAVIYGVQDRGNPKDNQEYSGFSIYAVGRSDLGKGWTAKAQINYISSFRFRQAWTQSYNEAVGGEIQSSAFVNKSWSTFSFDAVFARMTNFVSTEKQVTDPQTGASHYVADAVLIRKLPEFELTSRDRQFWKNIPIWYSFDTSAGLLSRSQPFFEGNTLLETFQTSSFTHRENLSPRVTSAFHFANIHLVPSFALHETFYSQAQSAYEDRYRVTGTNIIRSAREFTLDMILPSLARVYTGKTILGDKLKHVIEPRATYRYVTGVGDDFYRFIRFDETDLLADTNELTLSLSNRLYAKRGDSIQEILTWEVMQKRYFDPTFGGSLVAGQRNVFQSTADLTAYAFLVGPRSTSPVVSLLRINPIGGLGVSWQADYDPRRRGIVDSSFSFDYRWSKYFVSVGNNEVHSDPILLPAANQYRFRVGFGDPNHRGWNAGMEAIYDYRRSVVQYTTTQVTYNTDCCGFSVQYHRYNIGIRDEGQWRLAFSIANIGNFGTLRKQDRMF